jgi:hypothetical protein
MQTALTVFGNLGVALTIVATFIMLLTFRRPRRVGLLSPLISTAVSVMVLALVILLGARSNGLLALAILAVGTLVGVVRGYSLRLYRADGKVMGEHSLLFLLAWGVSLASTQWLTLLGSALAASLGLLPLLLTTGTQIGVNGCIFLRRLAMGGSSSV